MSGTLYVVGTPIGNLDDISPRVRATLGSVQLVAAEDTRRTRQLLFHLGLRPRLISYHAHSDRSRLDEVIAVLAEGHDVALVTDAGTPGISDPGAELVRSVRAAGHAVVPIAGPSAPALALSASGLAGDRYLFLGFLARKGAARREELRRAASEAWPVIIFEAPGRLADLLSDLAEVAGHDREAVVCRELTKLYEEIRTGSLAELLAWYSSHPARGEVTVVLGAASRTADEPVDEQVVHARIETLLAEGLSRRDVAAQISEEFGMPRNESYRRVTGTA